MTCTIYLGIIFNLWHKIILPTPFAVSKTYSPYEKQGYI